MQTQQSGMRTRIAAQTLIEKVLADYEARPPRSLLARFFGISPIPATDSSWHVGALGERIVAGALASLPEGWHTFNSIPIGSEEADIDHVVVGPAGIFAINSKHHRGKAIWVAGKTFLIDGQRQSYISVAAAEAERLTTALRARTAGIPTARGLIAVVGAKRLTLKEHPRHVDVLDARALRRWLLTQPRTMDARAVEQAAAVVDDSSTWRPTPTVDHADLSARFDQLMKRMSRAQAIQALWVAALALGLFGVCWAFISRMLGV